MRTHDHGAAAPDAFIQQQSWTWGRDGGRGRLPPPSLSSLPSRSPARVPAHCSTIPASPSQMKVKASLLRGHGRTGGQAGGGHGAVRMGWMDGGWECCDAVHSLAHTRAARENTTAIHPHSVANDKPALAMGVGRSRPIQIDHQQARTTVTGSAASHVQPSVPRATTQTNKPRKHLRKPDQTKSSQAAAAANNNKKRKTPSTTVTDRVNALMPEKSARRRVDLVLRRAGGKGMRQPVLPAVGCFWQCDRRSVGRSACRLMTPLATHTGKKKLGQARQRQHQYRCMHVAVDAIDGTCSPRRTDGRIAQLFFIWRRRHARGNVLTTLRTDDKRPRRRGIVRRQRPRKRGGVDGWSGARGRDTRAGQRGAGVSETKCRSLCAAAAAPVVMRRGERTVRGARGGFLVD
ncbi:hypothetical protein BKA81DRAFT_417485 [Phyllosticta paracitricarpa]